MGQFSTGVDTDGAGLAPANVTRAYQRAQQQGGAPGADGMKVDQLADYVKQYWPSLKARLLAGEHHRQAVRAVEIKVKQGSRTSPA